MDAAVENTVADEVDTDVAKYVCGLGHLHIP